jgi:hypothetical protein
MWRRAKEFGSIVFSRRCMGADYGKRIALQVGQRAVLTERWDKKATRERVRTPKANAK